MICSKLFLHFPKHPTLSAAYLTALAALSAAEKVAGRRAALMMFYWSN